MNKMLLVILTVVSFSVGAHPTADDWDREIDQYRKLVNMEARITVLEAEMDALLRPARLEALQRAREKREAQK